MTCKWVARGEPRVIQGRHLDDCELGEFCKGCQPCTEPHCRVCGITHANGSCAECQGETRGYLREIARMCDALPTEVVHRGIGGEAMMLWGPVADPEARGHLEASVAAGRVPADYLDHADGELHPLFVLGSWDMVWRDALDHDEAGVLTLAGAVDYLDRTLGYMADYEHVPFEDFARDLRQCAAHLERVLHDGEQRDEGVPCLTCERPLTRVWGKDEAADGWECKRCRAQSTEAQYQLAVKADYIASSEWLTDADMAVRTGVKAGTVRVWAQRNAVRRKRDAGRTLYAVADVETRKGSLMTIDETCATL